MLTQILIAIILLCASVWAQVDTSSAAVAATGTGGSGTGMLMPAPISGEGYSMGFTSETRANYLRGGLVFSSAYDTDATIGANRTAGERRQLFGLADNFTRSDAFALSLGVQL